MFLNTSDFDGCAATTQAKKKIELINVLKLSKRCSIDFGGKFYSEASLNFHAEGQGFETAGFTDIIGTDRRGHVNSTPVFRQVRVQTLDR
jgi:hypothetical protein